jgi:hypothetical protein
MEKFIKVHDDTIKPHIQNYIENLLSGGFAPSTFPWNYIPGLTNGKTPEPGFVNVLREDINICNKYYDILMSPLYNFLQTQHIILKYLIQCRSYLQTPSLNPTILKPHVDRGHPHLVCLYYVNDSDGDTIFYDNEKNEIKRVSPKKGRIVFFNGSILHSGSSPSKSTRILINYNFTVIQ